MISHAEVLLQYLHELWQTRTGTNVIIQCGKSQFTAHSLVLSAYSKFFRAILCTTVASPAGFFSIDISHTGVGAGQFLAVLRYMYTGIRPVTLDNPRRTLKKAFDTLEISTAHGLDFQEFVNKTGPAPEEQSSADSPGDDRPPSPAAGPTTSPVTSPCTGVVRRISTRRSQGRSRHTADTAESRRDDPNVELLLTCESTNVEKEPCHGPIPIDISPIKEKPADQSESILQPEEIKEEEDADPFTGPTPGNAYSSGDDDDNDDDVDDEDDDDDDGDNEMPDTNSDTDDLIALQAPEGRGRSTVQNSSQCDNPPQGSDTEESRDPSNPASEGLIALQTPEKSRISVREKRKISQKYPPELYVTPAKVRNRKTKSTPAAKIASSSVNQGVNVSSKPGPRSSRAKLRKSKADMIYYKAHNLKQCSVVLQRLDEITHEQKESGSPKKSIQKLDEITHEQKESGSPKKSKSVLGPRAAKLKAENKRAKSSVSPKRGRSKTDAKADKSKIDLGKVGEGEASSTGSDDSPEDTFPGDQGVTTNADVTLGSVTDAGEYLLVMPGTVTQEDAADATISDDLLITYADRTLLESDEDTTPETTDDTTEAGDAGITSKVHPDTGDTGTTAGVRPYYVKRVTPAVIEEVPIISDLEVTVTSEGQIPSVPEAQPVGDDVTTRATPAGGKKNTTRVLENFAAEILEISQTDLKSKMEARELSDHSYLNVKPPRPGHRNRYRTVSPPPLEGTPLPWAAGFSGSVSKPVDIKDEWETPPTPKRKRGPRKPAAQSADDKPPPKKRETKTKTAPKKRDTERKPADPIPCEFCGKLFQTKQKVWMHVSRVHKKKPEVTGEFPCTFCDTVCRSKRILGIHIRKRHILADQVPCDVCGKKVRRHYVKDHIRKAHSNKKALVCNICGLALQFEKRALEHHMYRKHGIGNPKTFTCEHCNKVFLESHKLKRHIKLVHQETRTFTCAICDGKYKTEVCLKLHQQRTHGEMCICGCGRVFTTYKELAEHRRVCTQRLLMGDDALVRAKHVFEASIDSSTGVIKKRAIDSEPLKESLQEVATTGRPKPKKRVRKKKKTEVKTEAGVVVSKKPTGRRPVTKATVPKEEHTVVKSEYEEMEVVVGYKEEVVEAPVEAAESSIEDDGSTSGDEITFEVTTRDKVRVEDTTDENVEYTTHIALANPAPLHEEGDTVYETETCTVDISELLGTEMAEGHNTGNVYIAPNNVYYITE